MGPHHESCTARRQMNMALGLTLASLTAKEEIKVIL